MSGRRGSSSGTTSGGSPDQKDGHRLGESVQAVDLAQEFVWSIVSVYMQLEEIRYAWAEILGISGPQWLILMAVHDLDQGRGVSVRDAAKMLHVDRSFITTQTQSLEKQGFMTRTVSTDDARIVLMAVTDKARAEIGTLSGRQRALNEFIFSDMDERSLRDIINKLKLLGTRLEKAPLKIAAET